MGAASRALAALVLAVTLGACAAQQITALGMAASFSDGRFKVDWQTAQTQSGQTLMTGYIQNIRGGGVRDVRLEVDTLDASGQVIGTASALVPGYLGGFGRNYFETPLEKTGVGYRVSVVGWDPAGNGQ